MSDKRAPRRSLDDWMELVTECRQSGLTDAAWCEAQGTFATRAATKSNVLKLKPPIFIFS